MNKAVLLATANGQTITYTSFVNSEDVSVIYMLASLSSANILISPLWISEAETEGDNEVRVIRIRASRRARE